LASSVRPEPVSKPLKNGDVYFFVVIDCVVKGYWDDESEKHKKRLMINTVHLTKEAAEQHLSVIQAINKQVAL